MDPSEASKEIEDDLSDWNTSRVFYSNNTLDPNAAHIPGFVNGDANRGALGVVAPAPLALPSGLDNPMSYEAPAVHQFLNFGHLGTGSVASEHLWQSENSQLMPSQLMPSSQMLMPQLLPASQMMSAPQLFVQSAPARPFVFDEEDDEVADLNMSLFSKVASPKQNHSFGLRLTANSCEEGLNFIADRALWNHEAHVAVHVEDAVQRADFMSSANLRVYYDIPDIESGRMRGTGVQAGIRFWFAVDVHPSSVGELLVNFSLSSGDLALFRKFCNLFAKGCGDLATTLSSDLGSDIFDRALIFNRTAGIDTNCVSPFGFRAAAPSELFLPFLGRDGVHHLLEMIASPRSDVAANALTAAIRACQSLPNAQLFAVCYLPNPSANGNQDVWDVIASILMRTCDVYDMDTSKEAQLESSWQVANLLHLLARHLQQCQTKDLLALGGPNAISYITGKLRDKVFPVVLRLLGSDKCPISLLDHHRLTLNALTILISSKNFSSNSDRSLAVALIGRGVLIKIAKSSRDPLLAACAQQIISIAQGRSRPG